MEDFEIYHQLEHGVKFMRHQEIIQQILEIILGGILQLHHDHDDKNLICF